MSGRCSSLSCAPAFAVALGPVARRPLTVVMDNQSSDKGPRSHALIQAAGASLLFLPPYRPDFNPIQNAFAKLKAMLRKAAEHTVDAFTPVERANYFSACGYDSD